MAGWIERSLLQVLLEHFSGKGQRMNRRSRTVALVFASLALGVGSASAQMTGQLKQTLRQTYTGVMFHERGVAGAGRERRG